MEDLLALHGEQARQDTFGQAGAKHDDLEQQQIRRVCWVYVGVRTSYSSSMVVEQKIERCELVARRPNAALDRSCYMMASHVHCTPKLGVRRIFVRQNVFDRDCAGAKWSVQSNVG